MSARAEFFLGTIAIATLTTAVLQVAVLLAAGLLVRRLQRLVDHVDRELKPVFESVQAIARDASRAASLATAQVERIDRAIGDVLQALDRVMVTVQRVLAGPVAEGAAWLAGFRTILNLFRDLRSRRRPAADDEDALFI